MSSVIMQELADFGQSIWLDYISRPMLDSGKLKKLIDQGLRGLTSNPSIFNKAISGSNDYDNAIVRLKGSDRSVFEIYDALTIKDIQDAADMFAPVYENTNGLDGYISLEINPKLAYDTEKTILEGKRLFREVDRKNLMLKVPSTDQGFTAITALIAEGINVNVTLIFSLGQYVATTEAYLAGLEKFVQKGGDPRSIGSVASIFVSRIDTLSDKIIEEKLKLEHDETRIGLLESLRGRTAVANSALIYKTYRDIFRSERFSALQKHGAQVQRVLWGSTSTKNPAYNDIKYVSELIGRDTVNTIPEPTLMAFIDHGRVKETLTASPAEYQSVLEKLTTCEIDLGEICSKLLGDGVLAFEKAFDSLLTAIEKKMRAST